MAAIYQADIYCTDCGNLIRKELDAANKTPEEPDDERSYDSDDYPKSCGDDEESDSPQHCGSGETCVNAIELSDGRKIGCFVSDSLTDYGVEYVKEAIAADKKKKNEVVQLWADHFSDYLS